MKSESDNNMLTDCNICKMLAESAIITKCGHCYCEECLKNHLYNKNHKCVVENCKMNLRTKDYFGSREHKKILKESFEHSTKTEMIIDTLSTILSTTDDKVLIISQWTSFLDLLQIPLDKLKINGSEVFYKCLDGRLSLDERDNNINEIKNSINHRVTLVSLKTCGLGLNLTYANQILFTDQWWNVAFELQAIDRVFRLGQRKKVSVYRFVIGTNEKPTVEHRIIKIKRRKQEVMNNVTGENRNLLYDRKLSFANLGDILGVNIEEVKAKNRSQNSKLVEAFRSNHS